VARAAGLDAEARRLAEILVEEWERHDFGLWDHVLAGRESQMLGPAHGFVGNVHTLRPYVDDAVLRARIERVLREHLVRDGEGVNWPPSPGHPLNRIQWCHGAPGIVATVGDLMPDDLLLAGAETTWRNGPLEKGPGLCHGTAGNGYALLKTYAVTGDEVWLERARSFAIAALGQLQGRYSLMTGDIGAALFAQACLDVDARFPILDVL
jgi:lantibiotic modifying enzyme